MSLPVRYWLATQTLFFKVTLTRVSTILFFSSVIFCFTQGIIQSFLYSVDTRWHQFPLHVVELSNINSAIFLEYTHHWTWSICHDTPVQGVSNACVHFFSAGEQNVTIPANFRRDTGTQTLENILDNGKWMTSEGIPFSNLALNTTQEGNETIVNVYQEQPPFALYPLDPVCIRTMLYPNEKLRQSIREDASLAAVNIWLLGIATFALAYESVPHLLALLLMRLLATVWSSYTIWRTINLGQRIQHLIGDPYTPCQLDIFSPYFKQRVTFQIVDLVFHSIALLSSLILSWNLIQRYQRSTFKRIGPPRHVVKIYRYFLTVLVGLQLSVFFLVVSMGLWIDQLRNSEIKKISLHTSLYEVISIATVILLLPWITMGWFAVRYEKGRLMIAFLATSTLFIASWSMMFYSQVYRFSFVDWPFFGSLTCTSFVFMLLSTGFGVVCWLNFNKGLAHFLYVEKALAQVAFEPEVFVHEKRSEYPPQPADHHISVNLGINLLPSVDELLPPYSYSGKPLAIDNKDGKPHINSMVRQFTQY